MQGRGGRGNFFGFGDPFAGFGGFGSHGSLLPSVFGGRDPFDDPFFTQPFGGNQFPSMMLPSPPALFSVHQQHIPQARAQLQPQNNVGSGPIIEELDSDDESSKVDCTMETKGNHIMHRRSGKEPYVEIPDDDDDDDDDAEDDTNGQVQCRNEYSSMNNISSHPQSQSFTFHSSSLTYGGANGSYYTKSSTRRSGSDGVIFEEKKEADSRSGQAFHQVSRGLYTKGHTLARNLNSDGRVDTKQILHNLNEDELHSFDKAWKGKSTKHLPGMSERFDGFDTSGAFVGGQGEQMRSGGWALPSSEQLQPVQSFKRARTDDVPAANPTTAFQSQNPGRRMSKTESRGKYRA